MSLAARCGLELIGTFFLMLVVATAAVGGMAGDMAPLAIGGILMAMVYMAGPHSGAHFNPAVTLAFLVRGGLPSREVVPYLLAQLIGAFLAAMVQMVLLETSATAEGLAALAALGEDGGRISDALQVGVAELLFTFALVLVVLNVASAPGQAPNQYFGVAIAITVMAGAFAVGPVSGAVFNPAVLLGLWSLGATTGAMFAVILATTLCGGLLAALTFRAVHGVGQGTGD